MNIDPGLPAQSAPPVIGAVPAMTEAPGAGFSLLLAVALPSAPAVAPGSTAPDAAPVPPQLRRPAPGSGLAASPPLVTNLPAPDPDAVASETAGRFAVESPHRLAAQIAAAVAPSPPVNTLVLPDVPVVQSVETPPTALAMAGPRPTKDGGTIVTMPPPRPTAKAEAGDRGAPGAAADDAPETALDLAIVLPDMLPQTVPPFLAPAQAEFPTTNRDTRLVALAASASILPETSRSGRDALLHRPIEITGVTALPARPVSDAAPLMAAPRPLPIDILPGPTPFPEVGPVVAAPNDRTSDRVPIAMASPVIAIVPPVPALSAQPIPAQPIPADATPVVPTPSPATDPAIVERRRRALPGDVANAPAPLPTALVDIAPRMLLTHDPAPQSTLPREAAALIAGAAATTTETAVATDRFGDVRIAVEGSATDVKVSMALTPTASLGAADAQRLATGLAADLAAAGVRLQSLDISGGDTARGGTPQGQRDPTPPRASQELPVPPRSPLALRSDRYA